jgi:transposase
MKLHANARLSVKGRELLVDRIEDAGWSVMQAAEAAGITERTVHKWLARYRAEGAAGLLDRSSAPLRVANRNEERRVNWPISGRSACYSLTTLAQGTPSRGRPHRRHLIPELDRRRCPRQPPSTGAALGAGDDLKRVGLLGAEASPDPLGYLIACSVTPPESSPLTTLVRRGSA